ncbi:MAG: hypothetical protein AB1813_22380 [Verrucomicrobiota bacterium]|jgi:hypothetical protein
MSIIKPLIVCSVLLAIPLAQADEKKPNPPAAKPGATANQSTVDLTVTGMR